MFLNLRLDVDVELAVFVFGYSAFAVCWRFLGIDGVTVLIDGLDLAIGGVSLAGLARFALLGYLTGLVVRRGDR